jgi:hypothetical protein
MTSALGGEGWIVCGSSTRMISDRMVSCPRRGTVPHEVCLACRHLMTSWTERQGPSWCEAELERGMSRRAVAASR